ncbi:RHS repeat-associated protein [Chitinophaga polysaccharea]|uniref:RHS repeat-associated protein n=2 Tax=Chitinophaga polysaccharea TaxID=1293035 RepID=A0A561Q4W1_9BACT|nr:RHS repeat-associated protein [Chitinophaga polysaccharea]
MRPIRGIILLLLILTGQWLNPGLLLAQTGLTVKKMLDGSKGELVANASVMVQDSAYFDATLKPKLEASYPVKNAVTFKLNEYSPVYPGGAFTATANVRITYTKPDQTTGTVDRTLAINYDTTTSYNSRSSFVFSDAHRVDVKLLSVTVSNPAVLGMLVLENEMNVKPVFKLDAVNDAVKNISYVNAPNTDSTDELTVRWDAVTGADEYDLEWAYVDSTALVNQRYGNPLNSNLVFRNNASRVSVSQNVYAIPLLYDNGGVLYVRVRAVQVKEKNSRTATSWSSDFANGMVAFNFTGHQRKLNWQSSIGFAEDGKRKAVVQYFDGSMLARQTVTKDNTTQTTTVAETMYDRQGRPVIQVLPAPTLENIMKYRPGFNTAVNGAEYDKDQYDNLTDPTQILTVAANPMGTGKGAANYYSPQNPNAAQGLERFVPDAQGYPFTETVYTPDNTGRISRQSGVGVDYKLRSGHETVYTYGSAAQKELDAIFGTDAGDESHYFKNMVRDANGQYSVTYQDMHGRTVATALAGGADSGRLKDLPTNIISPVTETLSGVGKTDFHDLEMSTRKSQLVERKEYYTFSYTLVPPVLKKKDCNGVDVCYIGKFDLEIKITDDSYNQLLGGQPVIKTFTNYNAGTVISDCNTPAPITVSFSLWLEKGSYDITKTLRINEAALNDYRNNLFLKGNVCTSLDKIIQEQRTLMGGTTCEPTCQSCLAGLGTYSSFVTRYMQQAGWNLADSANYRNELNAAWTKAVDACDLLCQKIPESASIRKAMLADMTAPSGQYANADSTRYEYSIFYNGNGAVNPRYKDTTIIYRDADGNPSMVLDELIDKMVTPQQLLPTQFAAKFQPSWADALLPYHPEYCKLLESERHKESQLWDIKFGAVDTYQAAKDSGYLNPTNGSGGVFAAYGTNVSRQDPLVSEKAGAYKGDFESHLTSYKNGVSIYAYSAIAVLCKKNDSNCASNFSGPGSVFNESSLCPGDLNMIWRSFREAYLSEKRKYIDNLVETAICPAGAAKVSAATLVQAGMVPDFPNATAIMQNGGYDYVLNPGTEAAMTDSAKKAQQQSYDQNCNSYVNTWMNQLAPCQYTPAQWQDVKALLLQVCKDGSDSAHPMGASSTPPDANNQSRSFESVINSYNTSHGITADRNVCNGLLIKTPAAYNAQSVTSNMPVLTKPGDCECGKVTTMKREYDLAHLGQETFSAYLMRTRQLNISQAQLNDLLDACNASGACTYIDHVVNIPPAFQCYSPAPCTTCKVVDSLYATFTAAYPGITPLIPEADTMQQRKNELFANYMNNRLGYSLSVVDYLVFRDSCQRSGYGDTVVGQQPLSISLLNGAGAKIIDIKRTQDGGLIIAGATLIANTNTYDKALLMKVKANGEVMWTKTFDAGSQRDHFMKVNETANGGFIAAGSTLNNTFTDDGITPTQGGYASIVRLDAAGNVVWNKGIYTGGTDGNEIRDIIELSNGDIAFTGMHNATSAQCDWMVGVLNSAGTVKWIRKMGSIYGDIAQAMVEDGDTLVMAGLYYVSGRYDFALNGINKGTGEYLGGRLYNQDDKKSDISAMYKLPGGTGYRLTMTGATDMGSSNGRGAVVDIALDGSVSRGVRLTGLESGYPNTYFLGSELLSDGSVLLAPNLDEPNNGIYVAKLAANGALSWSRRLQQTAAGSWVRKLVLGPGNNSIVEGAVFGRNATLFTYDLNGKAACNDTTVAMSADPLPVTVSTFTLSINEMINYPSFNSNSTVGTASFTTNYDYCQGGANGAMTLYKGPLLCGQSKPVFDYVPVATENSCTDSSFYLLNTAVEIYKSRVDSLRNDFDQAYIASCKQAAAAEVFTMAHGLSEYHYTLYYYDQAGNLVKTVPPAGVVLDRSDTWLNGVSAARANGTRKVPAHSLVTEYRYNTLNQVVEQRSPDGGLSRFWYDRLGRLAVSQNAQQRINNLYSYTLYDYLGRITEVGQLKSLTPITNLVSRNNTSLQQWLAAAASTKTEVTVTVYDAAYSPVAPLLVASNLRNRVAWSAVYNSGQDINTLSHASATYYSYDIHGNVDTLLQDYRLGAMGDNNNRFKKLQYNYDLVSGKVNEVAYQAGMPDAFYHRYTYDAENRITNVETSTDYFYWENDAFYQYYKHGPLARSVIGQQQVQGLDYAYTLQGWLKGVNSTTLTPAFDMGSDGNTGSLVARDAFGYGLHYFGDNDYKAISNTAKFATGPGNDTSIFKPLYNGNIAAMSVNLPAVGTPLLYTYRYDVLNRLSSMTAAKGLNTTTNTWSPSKLQDFAENVTYDANGNIQSYMRNGNGSLGGKFMSMDSLMYSYKLNSNQLDYVDDKVDSKNYSTDLDKQLPGNYQYDAIGNLIAEGKDSISWTVYGKIQRVKKADSTTIAYTYDVSGNRISKKVKNAETWYVRDATGNVMGIYTFGNTAVNSGDLTLTESHIYGSSRLGILNQNVNVQHVATPVVVTLPGVGNGINTIFNRGNKVFELSNHLGNVLATISDRKRPISINGTTVDHFDPIITTAQDYYPFGSLMPGRGGKLTAGGWAAGSDNVNGYTVPASLTISSRSNNQPSEYVASTDVTFIEGFDSGVGDTFTAYLADGSYAGGNGGSGASGGVGSYRYGFNGKENDNEVKGEGNQQDYGFRIYDPRLAKFLSVDPLSPKYPELTPYQFASNRPIDGIDEDGLEHSPAGKNTNGVPRDNTAVSPNSEHPAVIAYNKATASQRNWFRTMSASVGGSSSSIGATPNLGYYGNRQRAIQSQQAFLAVGWNADGSEPGWHKLSTNKTFSNLSRNMLMPMAEMGIGEGIFGLTVGGGFGKMLEIREASTKIDFIRDIYGVKRTKNIGLLEGVVNGGRINWIAISGDESLPGTIYSVNANNRFFQYKFIGRDAYSDTEAKLMEAFVAEHSNPDNVTGVLKLTTERAACGSCTGIIEQSRQFYKKVDLKLINGIGVKNK